MILRQRGGKRLIEEQGFGKCRYNTVPHTVHTAWQSQVEKFSFPGWGVFVGGGLEGAVRGIGKEIGRNARPFSRRQDASKAIQRAAPAMGQLGEIGTGRMFTGHHWYLF